MSNQEITFEKRYDLKESIKVEYGYMIYWLSPAKNDENSFSLTHVEISKEKETMDEDIVIPHILPGGQKITGLAMNWFYGLPFYIKSIILSEGIEFLSKSCFKGLTVRKLYIPDTVKEIPDSSFAKCKINEISGMKNVCSMGKRLFSGSKICSFEVPSGVTKIKERAFYSSNLHNIIMHENIDTIENGAFEKATKIKEIHWPKKCAKISANCFKGCEGLVRVLNTEEVTEVGSGAFAGCKKLQKVDLPQVSKIGDRAFGGTGIRTFVWPTNCKIIPNCCFEHSYIAKIENISNVEKMGVRAFGCTKLDSFSWPDKCLEIPRECFVYSTLSHIDNLSHVEVIETYAFAYTCINQFTWPDNCKAIPAFCFTSSRLAQIENIADVESIGEFAFSSTAIKNFSWPSKCKKIPTYCFSNSALVEINNLDNIELVEPRAFFLAESLDKLDFSVANGATLDYGALLGVPKECNVIFPYYISTEEVELAQAE